MARRSGRKARQSLALHSQAQCPAQSRADSTQIRTPGESALMPRTARVRLGRIWPPAAEAFPRIIDGNQSPAATPRPVTPSRRPASGYIDRQRHAEWLGGTGRTLAEPPFGSAWLTFSMIAKVSQNSGSVLWPGPQP